MDERQYVSAKISPFPYSYSVKLQATAADNSTVIFTDLDKQLETQAQYGNPNGLSFQISEETSIGTQNLGIGSVTLK